PARCALVFEQRDETSLVGRVGCGCGAGGDGDHPCDQRRKYYSRNEALSHVRPLASGPEQQARLSTASKRALDRRALRSVVSFGNPADPCGRSRGFASPPCGGFAFVVETGLVPRLFLCCNLSVSIGRGPYDLSLTRWVGWP